MSWERLTALADARARRDARMLLQLMIAAQGNEESWKAQAKRLRKLLE